MLRDWKPKKKEGDLNPPGDSFLEMEAAMAWGVTLDRWFRIHTVYRARMIAHFAYKNLREAYQMRDLEDEKKKRKKEGGYNRLMEELH